MSTTVTLQQNFLQPSKFQLVFDRVANTVFYCTHVAIPGMTLTEAKRDTPFTDLYVPGDKIVFQPLQFTFIMDPNFSGWTDVNIWMTGLGFPETFDQYKNLAANAVRRPGMPPAIGTAPPYSDATLYIYSNKNNPSMQFSFKDCYPIGLGDIEMDYGRSADEVVTASATFRYSYYTFKKL